MKINKNIGSYFLMLSLFYPVLLSSLSGFIVPKASLQLALNAFVLLLSGILHLNQNKATKRPIFNVLLCAIIFVVAYGYLIVKDYEYWAQFRYIAFLLFFIWGMKDSKWVEFLLKAILFMGIIYAVTTIWLAFDKNTYSNIIVNLYPSTKKTLLMLYEQHRFAGITEHYSTNGMMLANALIVAVSFYFATNRNNSTTMIRRYTIVLIVIIIALFLTAKRAHLIFTITASFLAYSVCTRKEKNFFMRSIGIIIIAILALTILGSLVPQVRMVIERFTNTADDVNMAGRHIFWDAAWSEFLDHKLFGIGWFGFRNNIAPTVNYTGHCHNVYIQLLCETGIIGFSIFITWFVLSLLIAIKIAYTYYPQSISTAAKAQIMFSLCYQIYFLMYCFSGNPLYDVYQYPIYFVACIIPMYYSVCPEINE